MENTALPVLSVKDVIQFIIQAQLRHQHLNRDVIIGLLGNRGDGKSVGAGVLVTTEHLVQNEPCFSNMGIDVTFQMDGAEAIEASQYINSLLQEQALERGKIAQQYTVKPGTVSYHSYDLDMQKFLAGTLECGVYVIDEINIALADARRAMAGQNLAADDASQMLRKGECNGIRGSALIYTCIHEMFVDSRIRDMTDIFIQTRDIALTPEGLSAKQKPGEKFKWLIFPMTRKLTGETYADTGKTIEAELNGKLWWGAINTDLKQRRLKYHVQNNIAGAPMDMELIDSPAITAAKSQWGWLVEKILQLHKEGYTKIMDRDLWDYLQLKARGISPILVGKQLKLMGIPKQQLRQGAFYYIDSFDIEKGNLENDIKQAQIG